MNSQDVIKIIKEQRYIGAIFSYGVVPVLLVMKDFEEKENFEECQIILNAINFMNKNLPLEDNEILLPTKYNSKVLEDMKSKFQRFGFKGDVFQANIPYYIREIAKMIKVP
jgi:hypothetical protein